ncbi:MAG TPA: YajQ family cyclic di-GMP-binding protein [Acidimicrobiales bacterium]|nr:YajQ family cyclic di-GMP-binding protein [Acidimicrobiales bacterium]|tara:strand:+ start:1532 stop:2020 length:489 start_codon:yes stop_codon:yes gene_type:complete
MPTFDITSTVDMQEVRNATDQASREVSQRYDFKDTGSTIDLSEAAIDIESSSDDRLNALRTVLEEKLVKRKVSLKALDRLQVQDAAGGRRRQTIALTSGINSEKAKEVNKFIKGLGLKGIQSQTQGDQVRVSGKKRDDLQNIITALKDTDFGIPLQFGNFRD